MRLQKVLADRGVASRRAAEELITAGRVRVDGAVVSKLGTRVSPAAELTVDGVAVPAAGRRRYVLLNKPRGALSTARDERGRDTVVSVVGARDRLYPVGRLDADSEGLLLLTNDGEWAQRVMHPSHGHEREYDVTVDGDLSEAALEHLRRGLRLEEGLARAVRVTVARRGPRGGRLRFVLRTGWRRQIRRMCAAVGLRVVRLQRIRLGALTLGRLRPGEWRELSPREVKAAAGGTQTGSGQGVEGPRFARAGDHRKGRRRGGQPSADPRRLRDRTRGGRAARV